MNKVIIGVVILFLAVGGFLLFGNSNSNFKNPEIQTPTPVVTQANKTNEAQSMSVVKAVEVEGGMFYFKPSEIQAKKGEKIKIVFTNTEGIHDWVLDEFNVKIPKIQGGEKAEVEFTAETRGTFDYYCSVGNHRQQGMVGKLIVTE